MFLRSFYKYTSHTILTLPQVFSPQNVLIHRSHSVIHAWNPTSQQKFTFVKHIKRTSWRMESSSSQFQPPEPQKQSGPPPIIPPPSPVPKKQENQLEQLKPIPSELTKEGPKMVTKVSETQLDITSKKFGWIVSGTAIGLMSAFFGKLYMLFGAVPLFLYHSKDLDVISKTFSRDSTFLWRYSKCWLLSKRIKNNNLTLSKVFQQQEKKHPDKLMLQLHDQNWKYKDVASYANRTSRLMQKYGFQKGDVVAMFALNSPEMVAIVLGMANIGIITTLISTELRNKGLTKAIKQSGCTGIIFDDELMHAFGDVYKNFEGIKIFQMRHKAKQPEFRVLEEELLKEYNDLPEVFVQVHHDDPLLYMFAPEDTVFKKPIVITHEKFLYNASATAMMLDLNASEKIYNPTPLHETSGMILGIGPSITNGVSTVLRSKFSASDYFRECYVYNCTVGQYSGSMCKQLLLSPVSPIETFHPVRAMYGTGLESDYWQEFVDRFGTKMYEVHDVSQEDIDLINFEGKIGVLGFRPKLIPSFVFPHYVIKVFGKEHIPVRNANGLCQLSEYGEPGMLIKLWTESENLPPNVKTIQNIFKRGDMAITTGELLTIDEKLYLRPLKKHLDKSWMNKLVTSEEVEYIASKFTSKRCVAYSLPMGYKQDIEILAIEDPKKTLDMKKFTDDLIDHLPKNWIPHYVRIVAKFELLASKKVDKQRLINQGLNMEGDLVHYFDKNLMCYKPLIWTTTNRPQMFVNESKIQPLMEADMTVPVASPQEELKVDKVEATQSKTNNMTVNKKMDAIKSRTIISVTITSPSQEAKHQTAPLVKEKKPITHYTSTKPIVTNILDAIETANKAESITTHPPLSDQTRMGASTKPAEKDSLSIKVEPNKVPTKYTVLTEPVMNKVLKERFSAETKTSSTSLRKPNSTSSLVDKKTAMLIKKITQLKADAKSIEKSSEPQKIETIKAKEPEIKKTESTVLSVTPEAPAKAKITNSAGQETKPDTNKKL